MKARKHIAHQMLLLLSAQLSLGVKFKNYHWNVEGPLFFNLHAFFEESYIHVEKSSDELAEMVRFYDIKVPSYEEMLMFDETKKIAEPHADAYTMVQDLLQDIQKLLGHFETSIAVASGLKQADQVFIDYCIEEMKVWQKKHWMLKAVCGS